MIDSSQTYQAVTPKRGVKITKILIGILIALILISAGFFLWTDWIKDRLAQRRELLVESATDPASLTTDQFRDLLKQIYGKFPGKKIGGLPIIKNINLTYQQKKVTTTSKPPQPDIQIDPIENQEPGLKWPTFTFGIWYNDPNDANDPTKSADAEAKLANIKDLVEKYYPIVAKIFGEPYNVDNRSIGFILYLPEDREPSYLEPFDAIVISGDQPQQVVPGLILGFWGEYSEYIPETWVYGIGYRVTDLAIRKVTGSYDLVMEEWRNNYEKFNIKDYPIAGASINYETDIFDSEVSRELLATAAFSKTDLYDNQFYKKLNQKLYEIPFTSTDWLDEMKIFNQVASIFPVIEGQQPNVWYGNQHVLHQTETNAQVLASMSLITQTFVVRNEANDKVEVYAFKMSPASGGGSCGNRPSNGTKFSPQVHSFTLNAENDTGNVVGQRNGVTHNNGIDRFDISYLSINANGRYLLKFSGNAQEKANFDYFANGIPAGLHGAIKNFGQGKITAYKENGAKIEEVSVDKGAFKFNLSLDGIITLKIKDYSGNDAFEKELAKDLGKYGAIMQSPTPSFPPAGGGNQTRGGGCSNIDPTNWQTYQGGEYTIKYPNDWGAAEETPTEGGKLSWFASFGPTDLAPLVYIGGYPQELAELKNHLTVDLGYNIIEETHETISGIQATRLTVQPAAGGSYPEYYYYLSIGNIPPVIRGPKESQILTNCEPQIFEKMLETYQYKGMGPQ